MKDILIVEDREENIEAAKKYFHSRDDVTLDIATDYESGIDKIHNNIYSVGIFDLELPRTKGKEIEKLGIELVKEATKYVIPSWAIMTSGIDHHNQKAAFVSYSFDPIMKNGERRFEEITETPKNNMYSWKNVYETLAGEKEERIRINSLNKDQQEIIKIMLRGEDTYGVPLFIYPPFVDKEIDESIFEFRKESSEKYLDEYGKRFTLEDSIVEDFFKGHKLLEQKIKK